MDSQEKISGYQSVVVSRLSLKQIFIIAVMAGAFFIIFGAKVNSLFLGFWLPIVVIVAYCSVVIRGSIDVPRAVAGDSCYYLGFIFTLVSLIASLWLISDVPDSGQVNFSQIVSSFGVALVTTVIGLIMRLVITSFDIETKQRQEQIERDIEQSLETFKGQIDVLVSTVTSSVINVSAKTEQAIIDTLQNYEAVNTNVLKSFESTFNESQQKFETAVDKLTIKLNSIEVSKDVITKPVLLSIKELTENLTNFSQSFTKGARELQSNNEQLAYHIAGSTDTINKHINSFEVQLSNVVREQANQYHVALSEIGDAVLASIGDIKDLKLDVEDEVANNASKLNMQFTSLSNSIEQSIPVLTDSLNTLVKETQTIHKQLSDSPNIVQSYVVSLQELTEKFKSLTTELPQLNNINEQLTKFEQLLDLTSKRTIETYKRFDETALATEGYTSNIAKDIAAVYSNLAQEIQKLRSTTT
ncbi:hypothetical protein [Shewanella xiamenensis]|uniref:hypothetical protein n=1 Tax=Shewanella xiamenensis TaxID=332186 RepID=UPI0008499EEE|nr:hypothetical protein [Shewanella xiamenensis]ODR84591.1 hypothetical protein ABT47_04305 [Shewanella xiamenensis]